MRSGRPRRWPPQRASLIAALCWCVSVAASARTSIGQQCLILALCPVASRHMPPPFPTPHAQVGTAHGRTLEALMRNSELNGLVGIACALRWHWTALAAIQSSAVCLITYSAGCGPQYWRFICPLHLHAGGWHHHSDAGRCKGRADQRGVSNAVVQCCTAASSPDLVL